jgi:HECT-like Ubiquitin-conjugating enzyme (E2)-binding
MTNSAKSTFQPSSINLTGSVPSPVLSSILSPPSQGNSSTQPRDEDNLDISSLDDVSNSPSPLALSIWVLQQSLRFGSTTISTAIASQTETQIQTQIRSSQIHNQNQSTMQILNKMQIQSPTQPKLEAGTFAMKVFWKLVSREEADSSVESESAEEVLLPTEVIDEIKACLQDSALVLPPSARKFKEWDVGLLERYEE